MKKMKEGGYHSQRIKFEGFFKSKTKILPKEDNPTSARQPHRPPLDIENKSSRSKRAKIESVSKQAEGIPLRDLLIGVV